MMLIASFGLASRSHAQGIEVDPDRLESLRAQQAEIAAKDKELAVERAAVQQEIETLRSEIYDLSQAAQKLERESLLLRERLDTLEADSARLNDSLLSDRTALQHMIAALQRIEMNPPPALAVSPDDAEAPFVAALYVKTLTERVQDRANLAAERLGEVRIVRADILAARADIRENEAELEQQRARIKSKVEEKSQYEKTIAQDQAATQERLSKLASEANDLQDLIRALETSTYAISPRLKPPKRNASDSDTPSEQPPASTPSLRRSNPLSALRLPTDSRPFEQARSGLVAPVQGRVSQGYSNARKGLTITTGSEAQIVSPYYGRVEFIGPFKNYDTVLILNLGDEFFMIFTGLGETYVEAGQVLGPGEPIGLMSFNDQNRAELYIELRRDGRTINPTPWLGSLFAP